MMSTRTTDSLAARLSAAREGSRARYGYRATASRSEALPIFLVAGREYDVARDATGLADGSDPIVGSGLGLRRYDFGLGLAELCNRDRLTGSSNPLSGLG